MLSFNNNNNNNNLSQCKRLYIIYIYIYSVNSNVKICVSSIGFEFRLETKVYIDEMKAMMRFIKKLKWNCENL